MRTALACFLAFVLFGAVSAQTPMTDSLIVNKFELHSRLNPSNLLFVHTDKTIYTNNETVWFSAYLIESGKSYSQKHTILSIAMVREDNREIILQERYLMKDGLSFGSMGLPDSIPPGNYQFIASTNVMDKNGKPLTVFTQPLTIKSITLNSFNATLSLLDSVVTGGVIRARLNVTPKESPQKSKIKRVITYSVGKGEKQTIVLKQNESSYTMSIPASELIQPNPTLFTTVIYDKEVQYLSVKLPELTVSRADVRFFPEGGNLVNGLPGIIALEAKTAQNIPVTLQGILCRNGLPFDTVTTNSYGFGSFKLRPDYEGIFTLKVSANNYFEKDTVYTLPKALDDGIILRLNNAIVNDTLKISLFSKSPQPVQVLIHNYRKVFAFFRIQAIPIGTKISIALPSLPKGLSTVTVLDNAGRPLAERLFFAHYDEKTTAAIQTDKLVYDRKAKVSVKLKLTEKDGKPVQGIMSVAVVQDNRIENSKQQDIESYVYLNHDLGNLPRDPAGRGYDNKDYLEAIMLIKGWRRFNWQNLIQVAAQDALVVQTTQITGRVRYNNKLLKKPVQFTVIRDSLFELLTTADDGSFNIQENQLLTAEGRNVLASVNQKNKIGYTIETDNPFMEINQGLADQFEIQNSRVALLIQTSSDQQLKGMERMIALQEVVVDGNKNDNSLYGMKGAGPNACGDFVCSFGILNCSNHVSGRAPIKGERFGNGFVYSGCVLDELNENKTIFKINPVFTSREFYGVNTDSAGLIEPQFLSTLFWSPGLMNNEKGETEFSFFTGDITGKFRIIVQGVGITDMIFEESSFMVK